MIVKKSGNPSIIIILINKYHNNPLHFTFILAHIEPIASEYIIIIIIIYVLSLAILEYQYLESNFAPHVPSDLNF